ncbi:MAG: S24 family peptidase [Prevotella sp.]
MERSERMKKAYEYLRFQGLAGTQEDVADMLKRQRTNVSSALNGNPKYLTDKFIEDFSKTFGTINPNWLITGEGSMLISDDNCQADPISGKSTSVQHAVNVPSISYTHGRPYFNVDFLGGFDIIINDQTVMPEYNIDFKPYNKEGVMWCNITGHSMDPLVSNGDIIAIKEMKDWRDFILYGEVYGIVTEDMRTVKVVTKSEQGQDFMRLVPINKSEEYQPQDIPVKLITHVFKVVGCMKKMW